MLIGGGVLVWEGKLTRCRGDAGEGDGGGGGALLREGLLMGKRTLAGGGH